SVHIRSQFDQCKRLELQPLDRKYFCYWDGCKRKAPYRKRLDLFNHLKNHVGSSKTTRRLLVTREQLINMGRAPTGRRWSDEAKAMSLENYHSRKTWK